MEYLSPREVELLDALKLVPVSGLDKHQAGAAININAWTAECFLHMLAGSGLVTCREGKYFITDKGSARAQQIALPGMNL